MRSQLQAKIIQDAQVHLASHIEPPATVWWPLRVGTGKINLMGRDWLSESMSKVWLLETQLAMAFPASIKAPTLDVEKSMYWEGNGVGLGIISSPPCGDGDGDKEIFILVPQLLLYLNFTYANVYLWGAYFYKLTFLNPKYKNHFHSPCLSTQPATSSSFLPHPISLSLFM